MTTKRVIWMDEVWYVALSADGTEATGELHATRRGAMNQQRKVATLERKSVLHGPECTCMSCMPRG